MLKIGITGGIGSGKTTVCRIFEVLGIPVFYADKEAKSLMNTDEILVEGVKETFGQESYSAKGELNRKYLADIVFADDEELKKLNELVHPAVFRAFDAWIKKQQKAPYVIKEAALLFESGSYKVCDYSILVTSPLELKIQRVMQRDAVSREMVLARMSKQLSEEQKQPMADFILKNDEQLLVIPQVLELHRRFMEARRSR